jgi:sec-independent protein translocase protein TatB
MFDIGWGEFVVIGIVALIAIGPKELPGVLRSLGQWMSKLRRMANEFQGQFQEAMREAELSELKKEVEEMSAAASRDFADFDPMAAVQKDIEDAVKPPASPAPAPGTEMVPLPSENLPAETPAPSLVVEPPKSSGGQGG